MNEEQRELFTILMEECGEVIQATSKLIRFGLDSKNPYTDQMAIDQVHNELNDLVTIIEALDHLNVINKHRVFSLQLIMKKINKLSRPGILKHSSFLKPSPCIHCGSKEHPQTSAGDGIRDECIDKEDCMDRWMKEKKNENLHSL